jgi:hypothetical protein
MLRLPTQAERFCMETQAQIKKTKKHKNLVVQKKMYNLRTVFNPYWR